MKKYTLLLLTVLVSTMTFAQILPDDVAGEAVMSSEVTLNSAEEVIANTISGEIDIDLPFDPLEEEDEETIPPIQYNSGYDLPDATMVETGPASIVLFLMALALGSLIYTYRLRTQD